MLQVILAILAFGALVVVHEFGHFITAKRGGVQVNEFWIGMGPTLVSKDWHGTKYCLKALPFGGACIMEGEDADSDSQKSFGKAKLSRRILIVVAGAMMNFIVGFLIVVVLNTTSGYPIIRPIIKEFQQGFRYQGETMLMVGDEILSIDGYTILQRRDIETGLAKGASDGKYDFTVRRGDKKITVTGVPLKAEFQDDKGNRLYGLTFTKVPSTVGTVLSESVRESANYARLIWGSLGMLVSGEVGVDQLSGPVGVATIMAETAKTSIASFFGLVAFISINLGIMNLLPLPALDGGRLVFLVIEGVRRKPVPAKYEGYVHAAGLVLLLALMVYVTGQDIFRLVTG